MASPDAHGVASLLLFADALMILAVIIYSPQLKPETQRHDFMIAPLAARCAATHPEPGQHVRSTGMYTAFQTLPRLGVFGSSGLEYRV